MSDEFSVPKIWSGQPAFILGGGPSIRDFDFARLKGRGRVFAVNDAAIVPGRATWADVFYFGDRRWLDWNRDRLKNFTGQYRISRQAVINVEGGPWNQLRFMPKQFSQWPDSVGGFCSGSQTLNVAYLFGCNPIFLLGFDMREQGVMNWHSNHQQPHVANQHQEHFIPTFELFNRELKKRNVTVINTNARSGLRCFPFASIEEILAMDDIALTERDKYLRVWERPEYRRISPGMLEVERATAVMGVTPGSTLIDFGSGPCRATKWFIDHGVRALAIDFAPNAREFQDVPFVEACLWETLDGVEHADFGFCCDVMEHIPEEKVDQVFSNIARLTDKTYFRIATRPDVMGPRLIQKPLHMTVRPWDFWCRKVQNHFGLVDVIERNDRDVMLLAAQ